MSNSMKSFVWCSSLFALFFLPLNFNSLYARGAPDYRTRTFTPTESHSVHESWAGSPVGGDEGHGWYSHSGPHYVRDGQYDSWQGHAYGPHPYDVGGAPGNYGYYGNQYPGMSDYTYSNYHTYDDTNFPGPYSQYYNDREGDGVGAGVYYNVR